MNKFYITTPIYYVNASPHIGHAYTTIASDCLARFKRIKGVTVFFLTGTDEHGEKIKKAAEKEKRDVNEFIDNVVENYISLWKTLNISYDFFIRTTQDAHIETVKAVVRILNKKGDIYKAKYRGFYCMPCETFWNDSQVKEAGGCPNCKRAVEELEEENYFLKLSKYESWFKEYLLNNPTFIQPKIRYNEVVGFLEKNPLEDLCISRPKKRISWGIDFPLDDNYVVYVWFDALVNYLSGVGFTFNEEKFKTFWPADIHFIGKDILRYHAIFWPIMLKALDIELPRVVFAHGWWKVGQEKMSKSLGNIINPLDVVKQVGVDSLRYFLLREVPFGLDGNYSWSTLINRTNSDLANDIGNLVYRTLNMAAKYFAAYVGSSSCALPPEFTKPLVLLREQYSLCMDNLHFSEALELVINFVRMMNKYIEDTKPWSLAKENKSKELKDFLYALLEGIRIVALYLYPFMPSSSKAIYRQLGLSDRPFILKEEQWASVKEYSTKKESPLFPRIDVD